jgi:hypothetical protein
MKKFVFLFPDQQHFDTMVSWGAYGWRTSSLDKKWKPLFDLAKTKGEKERIKKQYQRELNSRFSKYFFKKLNQSITERYRNNTFGINWIVLDNESISPYVDFRSGDKFISSGVSFVLTDKKEKTLTGYPNFEYLVDEIGDCEHLRVGGHMIWDCVSKLAEAAHKKGLDVLVDEDLTDFFQMHIREPLFRTGVYPSINIKEWLKQKGMDDAFEDFMSPRAKPWFYQAY